MVKCFNMYSTRSYRPVANQYVIQDGNLVIFQSYRSTCAIWDGERLILGRNWDYSRTTLKYLYAWLSMFCPGVCAEIIAANGNSGTEKIRRLIKSGVIEYNEELI